MGAWGFGIFENDDALDWVLDFEDHGVAAIERVFDAVMTSDYVEAPDASAALAAAEVVAAVSGRPSNRMWDNFQDAINEHKAAVAAASELKDEAQAVVRRVLTDSELMQLWSEGEGPEAQEVFKTWQATVLDLAARLETKQ